MTADTRQAPPRATCGPADRHPMAGHIPPLSPDPYTHARPIRPTPETGAQIDRCTAALQRIWDTAANLASEIADAEAANGIRTSPTGTRTTPADSAPAAYTDDGTLITLDAPALRGYDRAVLTRDIRQLAARIERAADDLERDAARRHCHACAAAAAGGSYGSSCHAAHTR